MPRDLTQAEKLMEEIRCHQGMITSYERRSDPTEYHKKVDELLDIITRAHLKIGDLTTEYEEAPKLLQQYRGRLKKAREELTKWNNRHKIDQLDKTLSQVEKLQSQLAELAAADPETFAKLAETSPALRALLGV
jgi:uncharacterized coiled-coil DUF342 family protein